MGAGRFDVVTGAFGYTGRGIAERLLALGRTVVNLTGHTERPSPFGDRVEVRRFDFDDPERLAEHLAGATTLFNTYWIRFARGDVTFERAVRNSETLFAAAERAGVRRIVHVSITNPSEDSPYPYFRGKARVERLLRGSGVSHAIVRPTVLFGRGDVLINNIAYVLRRLPVFGMPGEGRYEVRPVHVDDVAELCVDASLRRTDETFDAVGPETFAFDDLVRAIASRIGSRSRIVHVPPAAALGAARMIGLAVRDVALTSDELGGLMSNLVATDGPATGRVRLSDWLAEHAGELGRSWASELSRHYL